MGGAARIYSVTCPPCYFVYWAGYPGRARWLTIGGIQLQPSELVKPFLLLFYAWAMHTFPPRSIKNIFIHWALFIIPFLLVFPSAGPGSSIVYGVMWLSMMIAGGFRVRYVIIGFLVATLLLPVGWQDSMIINGPHRYICQSRH